MIAQVIEVVSQITTDDDVTYQSQWQHDLSTAKQTTTVINDGYTTGLAARRYLSVRRVLFLSLEITEAFMITGPTRKGGQAIFSITAPDKSGILLASQR